MSQDKTEKLAQYILSLKDFEFVDPEIPYNHMGATIADAILQSGLNYKSVVKPRVEEILAKYPEAKLTSSFLVLLKEAGANKVLHWNNMEKPNRVLALTKFLEDERIQTEHELKIWFENGDRISLLRNVRGIGDKTVDYLKLLSGIKTNAVDRHLLNFISQADVAVNGYSEANQLINDVAEFIDKDKAVLDHSIWKYMSEKRSQNRSNCSSGRET